MGDNFKIKEQPYSFSANNKITSDYFMTHIFFGHNKKDLAIMPNGDMRVFDENNSTCTIWQDRNKNGKYDTKVTASFDQNTVHDIEHLDENNKNEVNKVRIKKLAELQKASKMHDKFGIDIDGEIGNFKQSNAQGDCWLLAGLESMSLTKNGAKIIKDSISQDEKTGNVTVTLKGIKKTYTFTPKEIINAKNPLGLSQGDDDVRAFEMAVELHRRILIATSNYNKENKSLEPDLSNNVGEGTIGRPLTAGFGDELFFLLSGRKSKIYCSRSLPSKEVDYNITNKLLPFQKDPKRYADTVIFKETKEDMRSDHGYTLKKVDREYITVIDPHDTSEEIKIKRKDFVDNTDLIYECDMSQN